MKTLLEIYPQYDSSLDVEYKTDKNSYHTYLEDVYEDALKPYKNRKINLLEIGVAWSGSIRLWRDYFKYARIYGVDNFSCGPQYRAKSLDIIEGNLKNVTIIEKDAYTLSVAEDLPEFDVIIDDGPHTTYAQEKAIELYLPKLKTGGVMFIEDIAIDFEVDLSGDELEEHPKMKPLIDKISEGFEYKIYDLRLNAANRCDNPTEGRGDNVVLAIQHVSE